MTPPAPSGPRAAVVVNPAKADVAKLRENVVRAEVEHGWAESIWIETTPEDAGCAAATEALGADVDLVIAAGGDGTVRAVAETLRGTGTPLALVAAGTGNLLARNLDLHHQSIPDAVRTAFAGEDRAIDIGVVEFERADGGREVHGFVVMAGIGIDAQMVANTRPELKKRVGWLAYVDAIARSLRDHRRIRLRSQLDDGAPRASTVHSLLVGNCGLLPGNITLLPDAEIDDGLFDVVTLRPDGFLGWARVWVALVWENGVLRRSTVGRKLMSIGRQVRALRYQQGSRFAVRLERPDAVELDGDPFGEIVAFRAWVDAGAVLMRMPAAG